MSDGIITANSGGYLRIQNARANHLTPPLDMLESKTDAQLELIVLHMQTAAEVRARLADARSKGYTFLPCSCEKHADTGECLGWSEE